MNRSSTLAVVSGVVARAVGGGGRGSRRMRWTCRPEFALAEAFPLNFGQVLSREQLRWRPWGCDVDPGSDVVDVHVRDLRRKLGAERLETERGMGNRLVGAPSSCPARRRLADSTDA